MKIIPERVRKLWSAEEIRILVLLSLGSQIVLIFVSLFRKRCQSRLLSFTLWTSYLGADYVAALALGNLLNDETEASEQNINGDLTAFWAPFLLLHLGGPDSITSYSLEDNELWLRHFLGLVLEVSVAILVFLESLPSPHLWKVAIVVFAAGILKYAERTLALRSASMDQLRESMIGDPDPGPNYVKFMQEYHSRVTAGLNADITIAKEPPPSLPKEKALQLSDKEIVFGAYRFFQTVKRLTVDLMLSFQDRIESQTFFLMLDPIQAFFVVDVELSLLHDILHTKAVHVHTLRGRLVRALSLSLVVLSFVLFHRSGRRNFSEVDVIITYILLLAALGLEAIAAVLLVFSDWTIVALQDSGKLERAFIAPLKKIIRKVKFVDLIVRIRRWFFRGDTRRWSNSMRQCKLLCICLRDHKQTTFKRILHFLGMKELWDNYRYVEYTVVGDDQKTLIFEELKKKTYAAEGDSTEYKRLRACKGEWVLREKGYRELDWSMGKEFDESVLLWHIATSICYQMGEENGADADKTTNDPPKKVNSRHVKDDGVEGNKDLEANQSSSEKGKIESCDHRKISRQISDYLMYLVVFQPSLLPAGIGKIRFQDTCAEAKRFFTDNAMEIGLKDQYKGAAEASWLEVIKTHVKPKKKDLPRMEKAACGKLLEVADKMGAQLDPVQVKGDRSKSVLFDACKLAKEINELETRRRWIVISAVWVEMLCHAASNCKSYAHAKQLSQGGELLTHVWLLMAHMGIGEQYRIEAGHARAKLIVDI
ncbi:hypothetical protein OPV22_031986 [Ensete ventricosum]|uniref:DUF4220 domain-containing protein n=1 Tax=Ensete ventricosum TaxID=4639 RepID=A0AAV8PW57_ENSVE|nr:hypothetical protein OPV22_031986 [Ensete ventricosum]